MALSPVADVPHDEVQRYYSLIDISQPFPRKPYLAGGAAHETLEAMQSRRNCAIVSSCSADRDS
jgi:hypothetical protein